MLLRVYAGAIAANESAYWVADGLTLLVAGGAAGTQWWRERAWWRRYFHSRRELALMRARIKAAGPEKSSGS